MCCSGGYGGQFPLLLLYSALSLTGDLCSSLPVDFVFEARGSAHSEQQFDVKSLSVSPRMKQIDRNNNR